MNEKIPNLLKSLFKEHGTKIEFTKNKTIFSESDEANSVYFLMKGRVSLSKTTSGGKELTTRLCGHDDCFGENLLFTSIQTYPFSAKTIEASTILVISRSTLENLLHDNSSALLDCIQWLQIQNMREQSKLRDLLLYGKKGALYSTLIRLSNTFGVKNEDGSIIIPERYTHSDLANLCASSREVVNRLMKELKEAHVISDQAGIITILKITYLKTYCECDQCPDSLCKLN